MLQITKNRLSTNIRILLKASETSFCYQECKKAHKKMELLIMLATIMIVALIMLIWKKMTYWKCRGILHIPMIPIFGCRYVKLFFSGDPITKFTDELYNNFPGSKYFAMTMFNQPTVVLKDPELIRDICVKNFDHAPDRLPFIDEKMDPIIGKNLFSLRSERWKKVRNVLSPSFTSSKMKFIFQLVDKVSEDFVQYFIDNPKFAKLIDAKDVFSRYTNDVIATSAFGINVNSMKNRENEFYLKGKDTVDLSGMKKILKILASKIFPRLMRIMGFTHLSYDTNRFFVNLIRDTVRIRDEEKILRPDMIHLLMLARDSDSFKMTVDDITAQAFFFFLAGFETTSTVISFVCHQLAHHQDVQEKLRNEVDNIIEEEGISYESLSKMKYMEMVVNETLRLFPPAVILDRLSVKPIDLPPAFPGDKNVTLDSNTAFWIPIYSLQRDPKYFPNPEFFDPERFNEENEETKIPAYIYAPFGLGPRKCIGQRFAMMEIKLVLVKLIGKFVINPSEKSPKIVKMARKSFTMTPEDGLWMTFEPRI